jgi:hypothetical protein
METDSQRFIFILDIIVRKIRLVSLNQRNPRLFNSTYEYQSLYSSRMMLAVVMFTLVCQDSEL